MPDRSSSTRSNGKQQVQETVMYPVQTMRTAAEKVPGSERVRGVFDDMLNTVGIVSPRARRVAAYTGAGLLGVAGVIEWPVAVVGAAAVWLTQPRPADMDGEAEATGTARTAKRTTKQAASRSRSRSGNGSRTAKKGSSKSAAAKSTAKKTTSASRAKAGARKKS